MGSGQVGLLGESRIGPDWAGLSYRAELASSWVEWAAGPNWAVGSGGTAGPDWATARHGLGCSTRPLLDTGWAARDRPARRGRHPGKEWRVQGDVIRLTPVAEQGDSPLLQTPGDLLEVIRAEGLFSEGIWARASGNEGELREKRKRLVRAATDGFFL
ncbi:hypothetical protein CRG98_002710 [Punica granatum]|uniref:Uncharacterized protein n=1 Tax=Punica granatum TaxID=22663 RepID=A0A2I0L8F8_PUNGR|nr:hypothetical protein CRG98_002710 [Punica granatum]